MSAGGFVEFCENLSPPVEFEAGQRVACLVCFDGVEPCEFEGEEREWARRLFGDVEIVPLLARAVIAWVCGGRSGKSYLLNLRGLHLALTVDLSELAPGEEAFVAIIAPTLELAQQGLRYAAGAARFDPYIKNLIVRDTADELLLKRKDGALVALRTFAASAGGVSGRGKSLVALILDETCFFRDKAGGVVNDEDIYKAASPRVMDGGCSMIASTPWTSSGLLYDFWKRNFGKPSFALVAHAATRTMRAAPHILAMVEREYARDPDNAATEFGAEWGSTDTVRFFTDADLEALFVDEPERTAPEPGDTVAAAADLGFTRNSSTLCVLAEAGGILRPVRLVERKPKPGSPLVPSEVCGEIAAELVACSCRTVATDQHYRETLREHVAKIGVSLYDGGAPDERFVSLRTQIRAGLIKVSQHAPYAARLRRQLERVKSRQLAGGRLSISLPTDLDGSHADAADVLARAVWARSRYGGTKIKGVVDPVQAEEDRMIQQRENAVRREAGKPWWKRKKGQG